MQSSSNATFESEPLHIYVYAHYLCYCLLLFVCIDSLYFLTRLNNYALCPTVVLPYSYVLGQRSEPHTSKSTRIFLLCNWASEASPILASQREIFYVCIYIYLFIYIFIYLYVLVRSSGGAWLSSPTVHLHSASKYIATYNIANNYILVRSKCACVGRG